MGFEIAECGKVTNEPASTLQDITITGQNQIPSGVSGSQSGSCMNPRKDPPICLVFG